MLTTSNGETKRSGKDFATDQDVRWCPGCGDYSILKQVQSTLAETGLKNEDIVFISGIGCAARFPYYIESYGMHSIHGRAPAIATGLKISNPNLSIWVATGDGDCLSIGGNHLIHVLRRNPDLNIIMFNNEIYGLTKGQYSPTSPIGTISKSSPSGSLDTPFSPLKLCMGAEATFIARSMDRDPVHLRTTLLEANQHQGTSFVEVYQNCNVFNDGAFFQYSDKKSKADTTIILEQNQPLLFGEEKEKGIILDGFQPKVVHLGEAVGHADLWVHDAYDPVKASLITQYFDDPNNDLPKPFGIIFKKERPTYESLIIEQMNASKSAKGEEHLDALLSGENTWTVS